MGLKIRFRILDNKNHFNKKQSTYMNNSWSNQNQNLQNLDFWYIKPKKGHTDSISIS